jgi:hypothetical protein
MRDNFFQLLSKNLSDFFSKLKLISNVLNKLRLIQKLFELHKELDSLLKLFSKKT